MFMHQPAVSPSLCACAVIAAMSGKRSVLTWGDDHRNAVRTVRPRLVHRPHTYSAWGRRGKLPGASGAYGTQEAGACSPHVQYGGPGTYVSA